MDRRTRAIGITLGVVVAMVVLAGLIAFNLVSREASPGPGWIRAGSVGDIERQGVTKVDDSAYVVSYLDGEVWVDPEQRVSGVPVR